ncbi:MAG: TldD/PmbA family protein [Chloroflexota bacterium]|nr:TldD/PmbA family protein [Chloroflexota bacterium]
MTLLDKLSERAEQSEVFEIASESVQIGFEANVLRSAQVEETRGIALRAIVDGRLGFAASSDLTAEERLLDNVLASAQHGDPAPFAFPEPAPGPQVEVYDDEVASLTIPDLVSLGQELMSIVHQVDPKVHVKLDIERSLRHASVRNSRGGQAEEIRSPLSISLMIERVRGDDVLVIYDYWSATDLESPPQEFMRSAAHKLELAEESATVSSGPQPVLFSPMGATVLGLPLMRAVDGKNVYRGVSPLAGRLGEQLFDPQLTLVDDGTLDGRPSSASHDDEGVPTQRTVLIEEGVVQSFLYDLKTAAQAGAQSTGNGSRGLFSPPRPSPSNLIISPGETPLSDIIAGIEEGVLVDSPLGLGQGNVISGVFSNTWGLAYRVEKGEIVGRAKDISIAGNIYQDLRHIAAISQESEWVYGGLRMPYILLGSVNVTSK